MKNTFNELVDKRNEWLLSGKNELKKKEDNYFSKMIEVERLILSLKEKVKENKNIKILTFKYYYKD